MSRVAMFRFAAIACLALSAAACGDSREGAPPPPPAATPEPVPPRPTETAPPLPPDGTVPAEPAQPAAGTPAAPAATGAGDPAKGAPLYATYCASCHGPKGCGDGPLSATLDPKPAKHCDGNVMNQLKDDYLLKVVKEGGASVGKSPLMAPWGGTLTDPQIRDVVAFVRSLADPPYKPGT